MKILAIADTESKALWDYYQPEMLADVDLIISCGDLDPAYLEFLVTMAHCPLLYVHGNHDGRYSETPPEGCFCIEDSIFRYQGLRILGLGGSLRYKEGLCMYTEKEMRRRVSKARLKAFFKGGIDILVTHAPAGGWGDLEDPPHRGFSCFNTLLQAVKPRYMLHGHVHKNYGRIEWERIHDCGTKLVNVSGYYYLEI
ncbi:MAG: metallophosphoesterase family protein [Eubacteriales bacterium]|nr:metallophosphoesterase family protein [Eubacteriales bacterium]